MVIGVFNYIMNFKLAY